MSSHECPVIKIKLEPHTNADALSIVRIYNYQCIVRTADWTDGDLAAYVPPDYVVPDVGPFAFLNGKTRIRSRRLRGEWSMGLLVPAPAGLQAGDNAMEALGVRRYEPPVSDSSPGHGPCDAVGAPPGIDHKYDVENWYRYGPVIADGTEVVVTEKIHGTNARFSFREGEMWAASRTRWLRQDNGNLWWRALAQYPGIRKLMETLPGYTLYGEIYGVQDLRYGLEKGTFGFAAFDIMCINGLWLDCEDLRTYCRVNAIPVVPEIWRGPYSSDVEGLASGPSLVAGADHIREGAVIRPLHEKWHPSIGRVQLKIVSNEYLERSK